jgi:hypothetical protein
MSKAIVNTDKTVNKYITDKRQRIKEIVNDKEKFEKLPQQRQLELQAQLEILEVLNERKINEEKIIGT